MSKHKKPAWMEEFMAFAVKGNAMALAVGTIIGGAFSTITKSLTEDIIMPIVAIFMGGIERIVWMPKELKDDVAERLNKTAKELYGVENFTDMVADETVTTDCEELLNWLTEKGHPVLGLEPLM